MEAGEVDRGALLSPLVDVLREGGVVLVAAGRLEVIALELVVLHHRVVVLADVPHGHLFRAVGALVHEGPSGDERGRGLGPVHLAVQLPVLPDLAFDVVPRLLRHDEKADPELRHDARRFRRHRGRVGTAPERAEGGGAKVAAGLLDELAVELDVALLEALQHVLGVLDESLPRLVHVDPEALELHPAEPAPDAEDDAPAGDVVEHRDLFGHPHRVVPGEHHHHRAELRALGPAGHVGQELDDVRAHRVVGEVVLDRPDRLETERLGELREPELVPVDLVVGEGVVRILEDGGVADVHG